MLSVNVLGELVDNYPRRTNVLEAIGETINGNYIVLQDENECQGVISYHLMNSLREDEMIFIQDNIVSTNYSFRLNKNNCWDII